jgi:Chromo (CHRromatin Organisation MOdifier) domain
VPVDAQTVRTQDAARPEPELESEPVIVKSETAEENTDPHQRFGYSVTSPLPSDDAQDEYEVEAIIDHDEHDDGTMQFLVRWKGYGPDEDLWIPDSELMASASSIYSNYMSSLNSHFRKKGA